MFIKARRNKENLWKMMHTGMMDKSSIMYNKIGTVFHETT